MNILKKYCLLGAVLVFGASFANAEITVKDTVSPEFIHNQGFSDEISRVIDVKTVSPLAPVEEEEAAPSKFRYFLWKTWDPAIDRPGNWVNHDIKFHNSINDL